MLSKTCHIKQNDYFCYCSAKKLYEKLLIPIRNNAETGTHVMHFNFEVGRSLLPPAPPGAPATPLTPRLGVLYRRASQRASHRCCCKVVGVPVYNSKLFAVAYFIFSSTSAPVWFSRVSVSGGYRYRSVTSSLIISYRTIVTNDCYYCCYLDNIIYNQ